MGVNGLWRLLQVSGRQIEMKQLKGSIVAIDVSIWMIRIIHGMANAGASSFQKGHLLGMLKRILFLLQNEIKPVFVFDGPAPALKQRTLQYRQQQRNKSQLNVQKMAEKYIVKLLEKGIDLTNIINGGQIQEEEEEKESEIEQLILNYSDQEQDQPNSDPEMLEIERQKQTDIMILEYKSYRAIHPKKAKLTENQFEALSYEDKIDYIETIEDQIYHNRNKNHYKHENQQNLQVEQDKQVIQRISNNQLKLYIQNASNKDKIKKVKSEALKQMESLRIQRLLDQYDDPESKALKEFFMNNDDVEIKLNTLGVKDVYLSLSDPQQRKNILELIYGNKKEKKQFKLKEWQLENEHQKRISEKIKKRHLQELQNQQDDLQFASDFEPEVEKEQTDNLMMKYEITDFDQMKNILISQLIEESSQSQSYHKETYEKEDYKSNNISYHNQIDEIDDVYIQDKESNIYDQADAYDQIIEDDQDEQNNSIYDQIIEEDQIIQDDDSMVEKDYNHSHDKNIDNNYSNSLSISKQDMIIPPPPIHSKTSSPYHRASSQSEVSQKQQIQDQVPLQSLQEALQQQVSQQEPLMVEELEKKVFQQVQVEEEEIPFTKQPTFFKQSQIKEESIFDNEQPQQEIHQDVSIDEMISDILKYTNLKSLEFGSLQTKFDEVKYLLSIFGIPWVEAPGEAEAQCSYLQQENLVDYVISDDSDTFLFGGSKVIRGLFDQKQIMEFYSIEQIEEELGLTQEKLIYLALFLGSDYTEGVKGVGIVNAMEIVEAFDSTDGLKRFAKWASKADILLENIDSHYENIPEKERIYKEYHKNFKKVWELPYQFPEAQVIDGYLDPSVDKSKEKFTWAKPSLKKIEEYCLKTLEWQEEDGKTLQLLEAIKIILEQNNTQARITSYFKPDLSKKLAIIRSRRINETVNNLINKSPSRDQIQSKKKRQILQDIIKSQEKMKKPRKKNPIIQKKSEEIVDVQDDVIDHYKFIKKRKHKKQD